jgi:hypothetical protein
MDTIDSRIAQNEVLYRDVNENIRKTSTDGRHEDAHFVCECGDISCEERIALPMDAYTSIRESDLHFFVKPGHEIPRAEEVIARHPNYVVVKKPEDVRSIVGRD